MFKKISFWLVACVQFFCFFAYAERAEFTHWNDDLGLVGLFLPENPVILEAGAHYGEDTVRMKYKWPDSTIHAFEPYPVSFSYLESSTQSLPNVFRYPFALFSTSGQYAFYVVASNDGASSLLQPQTYTKEAYQGPCIVVEAKNLDEWAQENYVDRIDFMWLDMEGAELQTLQSAPKILSTVKVIYTETNFWHCRIGTTQYSVFKKFLDSKGFEEVRHWAGVGQGNAVFVRKTVLNEVLKKK